MTKHRLKTSPFWAIAVVAALGMGLSACGGGSDGLSAAQQEAVDEAARIKAENEAAETAYEMAKMAIAAAETSEAAMEALDDVKDKITGTQTDELQTMVDERIEAIEKAERAATQRTALMEAADMVDTSDLMTQEAVDTARAAIAGLRQAIADAVDVDDKAMYQTQLDTAVAAVDTAQGDITTDMNRMNQMGDLSDASTALQAALAAFAGSTPTQAELDAANTALGELNDAIMAGMDLTDAEKAPYQREANNAAAPITAAKTAVDEAEAEAEKVANAAMAATAAKLYEGLDWEPSDATLTVTYNNQGFSLTIGTDDNNSLSEDKKTTVNAHHGWEGMRFANNPGKGDNSYEAMVYSNVGKPTEGKPLELGEDGVVAQDELTAADVVIPSITRTTGTETIERPESNPDGQTIFNFPGSYQGVSGTYSCTLPEAGNNCTAAVALNGKGFTLGGAGGTWTFKPSDPEDKTMSTPDAAYSYYGWWIRTMPDGDLDTSAFHGFRPADETVSGIDDLNGTAVYMGGAAGKYALSSSTGGTNDAGHFTADVMLSADFDDDMISGTVDNFMGADGEMRNWSVELMKSGIGDNGAIMGEDGSGSPMMTKWTIDGTTAAASGEWSGNLREVDADSRVPQVATGTFYTVYGTAGRMVGAFGANVQ